MDTTQLAHSMASLRRAVGIAGGQVALERLTGIRQQTLSYRLNNEIPLQSGDEVVAVEAATGVSRHDLRPDLYPREDTPAPPPASPSRAGGSPLEGVRA